MDALPVVDVDDLWVVEGANNVVQAVDGLVVAL
jgi:hypothetical protein